MKGVTSNASFCAMTCNEGGFHKFLTDQYSVIHGSIENSEAAKQVVYKLCGISSRRELNEQGPSLKRWLDLRADYAAWLLL